MRPQMAIPTLLLIAAGLGGCNTAAPGVLPRDPVPPPPSVSSGVSNRQAGAERVNPSVQRRALSVPDRIETPRPSAPQVQPIMTPSGAGAGFRF